MLLSCSGSEVLKAGYRVADWNSYLVVGTEIPTWSPTPWGSMCNGDDQLLDEDGCKHVVDVLLCISIVMSTCRHRVGTHYA